MSALATAIGKRDTKAATLATDALLVLTGSLFVAGLAQLYIRLPFTPVPITGQTLGVLLVAGALGGLRGGASLLLYIAWIAMGLPFAAEGSGGADLLGITSATGGYLWGFVISAAIVGWLAERGWDRKLSSAMGAMLIGEIIIFGFGVPWLASALGVPGEKALEFGLYPFVLGDLLKLLIAAAALPAAWRLVPKR